MHPSCFSKFRRSFVLAAALFTVAFAGCLHSVNPNVDTIICQGDNNCPSGYVCAIKGQPGGCRKSIGGTDGSGDVTERPDGTSTGVDVVGRLDSMIVDMASGGDGAVVPDTAADLVIGGQDLPTGQPDGASPSLPELQPDVTIVPEIRDAALESRDAGMGVPSDLPVDQPLACNGGCCSSLDCPLTAPVCNSSNQCTKCGSDTDCSGRSATACNTTTGACVQCTKNAQCGTTAVCDTSTNKCVGCTQRSDCPGACQTCSSGTCVAVKSADDASKCAGTCDSNGECKAKAGQKCDAVAAGCITGTTCADGYCCNRACTGTCEACDLATSPGTCSVPPANTAARHGSCAGSGACAGTCQGKPDGTCTFPTTACGTAGCATTASTQAVGTCNGAGTCNMPAPVSCETGATCSGSACSCPQGTVDCGTSGCINTSGSDVNHCGACTTVCASNQSCSSGTCACTSGAAACGGCLAWDFESSSNPTPWTLEVTPESPGPNGATNIGVTQSKYNGGSHALIVPVQIDFSTTFAVEATVSLSCKVNLSGYTGWAYMYFDGSYPLSDFGNQLVLDTWTSSGTKAEHNVPFFGNIPINAWFKVPLAFSNPTPVDRIGLSLTPATNWTGTMYIDDVVINGL